MTGSAEIKVAFVERAFAPGTAASAPNGISRSAGLKTAVSPARERSFASSLRSILVSSETPEVGVEKTVKPEPAPDVTAQAQCTMKVAGTTMNRFGQPLETVPERHHNRVPTTAKMIAPRSAIARTTVEPGTPSLQASGQPVTSSLKKGTLEPSKGARTRHERKDARKEPHSTNFAQITAAQPSAPMVSSAQPVRVPGPVRNPSSTGGEPKARFLVNASAPTPQVFSTKNGIATLTGARSGSARPATDEIPSQTEPVLGPAFDPAMDASSIGPDAQPASTGKEPAVASGALQETSLASSRAQNHGASIAPSLPGHAEAGKLPVPSVSSSNPQRETAVIAAWSAADEKLASASNGVASKVESAQTRTNALHTSATLAVHPAAIQSVASTPFQPGATVAHDASPAHAASDTQGNSGLNADLPPSGAKLLSPYETFAALDSTGNKGAPTWTHASAHQAEAGFQDPSLGWVAVRALADAKGIHAALVPGSTDAAQALGTHLAGLNAYLTEQRTPVATLTLAAQESQWAGQGMGQGSGQNTRQGEPQQQPDARDGAFAITAANHSHAVVTASGTGAPSTGIESEGVYISVMA